MSDKLQESMSQSLHPVSQEPKVVRGGLLGGMAGRPSDRNQPQRQDGAGGCGADADAGLTDVLAAGVRRGGSCTTLKDG